MVSGLLRPHEQLFRVPTGAVHRPQGSFRWGHQNLGDPLGYHQVYASQFWIPLGSEGQEALRGWMCAAIQVRQKLGFICFLQDLKETLAQELDFENEARNSERCAQELKHLRFVSVPKVFWEQTSKVSLLSEVLSVPAVADAVRFRSSEGSDGRVLPRLQDQQFGGNQKTRTESERREWKQPEWPSL